MRTLRIGIAILCLSLAATVAEAKGSTSLSGVNSHLAMKVREIIRSCGSEIISSVRHTNVAGTHRLSEHAIGRAVDIRGNPRCIYAHLRGWNHHGGGYTVDYSAVRHVHVSYGGREAGLIFRHGGHHRRIRFAHMRSIQPVTYQSYLQ